MAGCDKCLWFGQCESVNACNYYTPLNDDELVDEVIENARSEFHKEWAVYLSQNNS